eukprot:6205349-Pleurochrysis_carterae.AAC.2
MVFTIVAIAGSKELGDALDKVLLLFGELAVGSIYFNTASWDLRKMAASVLAAAKTFNNLRPLISGNPLASVRKIQLQFDGMSWTRGHGCTRLIVRTPDLLVEINSNRARCLYPQRAPCCNALLAVKRCAPSKDVPSSLPLFDASACRCQL